MQGEAPVARAQAWLGELEGGGSQTDFGEGAEGTQSLALEDTGAAAGPGSLGESRAAIVLEGLDARGGSQEVQEIRRGSKAQFGLGDFGQMADERAWAEVAILVAEWPARQDERGAGQQAERGEASELELALG